MKEKLIIIFIVFSIFLFGDDLNFFHKRLFGAGSNVVGELGNGRNFIKDNPVKVDIEENVVDISAGQDFSLFLLSDGTVWASGRDDFMQLGDGSWDWEYIEHIGGKTRIDKYFTVQVKSWVWDESKREWIYGDLKDIVQIFAGSYYALALDKSGNVWGWGFGFYGTIPGEYGHNNICGGGFIIHGSDEFKDIISISAGPYHSLALKKDGTVWGWGYNYALQVSPYAPCTSSCIIWDPVKVKYVEDVVAISAGTVHSLALKKDGTVYAWGFNQNGELGDGTYAQKSYLTKAKINDVVQIQAGEFFSVALKKDGTVWVWGDNWWGVFGDGTSNNDYPYPRKVEGLPKIKKISANVHSIMALDYEGNVWTWGGPVGYRDEENERYEKIKRPIKISNLSFISSMSQGYDHQLFLKNDGSAWGRGSNYYGQLGIWEFGYEPYFASGYEIDGLIQVSAGYLFSLALKKDGTVWGWGYNYYGQLGIGKENYEFLYSLVPVKVLIEDVIQISTGYDFALALKSDGTVWAWGSNEYNQLGIEGIENSNIPIKVNNLDNIVKVSAGSAKSVALKNDGTVWIWGGGSGSKVPVKIKNLSNIIDISAGGREEIFLKNDGTVWKLGSNNLAIQISNLSNIIKISAGDWHCLALRNDGKLFVWGDGVKWEKDENGDYREKSINAPEEMEGLPEISQVYAGNYSSIVVDKDGYLWGWGDNFYGKLGFGDRYDQYEPKKIEGIKNPISIGMGYYHTLAIGEYDLKPKEPSK
jgi:alpha-tubulin suppressor-like RCC1 family protein